MAEAIGLTASIISILGAADAVLISLAKLKVFRKAPAELLSLNNEVADLRIVMGQVESYVASEGVVTSSSPRNLIQQMSTQVERAKAELLQLEQLIHYRFLKSGTFEGSYKVFRLEWLKSKSIVETHRQNIRETRQNIFTQLLLITATQQSRIRLRIDEVHLLSTNLQANQNLLAQTVNDQSTSSSRAFAQVLSQSLEFRRLLESSSSSRNLRPIRERPNHQGNPSPRSVIRISAYVPSLRQRFCRTDCHCHCHQRKQFTSPSFFRKFLGQLFVGYSGYPSIEITRCSNPSCGAYLELKAMVRYYFPSWLVSKAIVMSLDSSGNSGPCMTLTVRNVLPYSAEVWQMIYQENIEGLQLLLQNRLASPNDVDIDGQNLLCHSLAPQKIQDLRICKLLIDAGADIYYDPASRSAFRSAYFWLIHQIFRARDSPAKSDELRSLLPSCDFEPFQFSELHKAVLNLNATSLDQALSSPDQDLDTFDSTGMTPLAWAAELGDGVAVQRLLESGASVNACGIAEFSPLVRAVIYSDLTIVRLLIQAGADPCQVLLYWACFSNQSPREICQLLIEAGVDVNHPDLNETPPLIYACVCGVTSVVGLLLEREADASAQDQDGDTALNNAIFFASHECISLLLRQGAPYDTVNKVGDTILHFAARHADMCSVEILLDFELKNLDTHARNRSGKTASQLAWERERSPEGFIEVFHALLFEIEMRNDNAKRQQRQGAIVEEVDNEAGDGANFAAEDVFEDALENQGN